MGGTIANNNGDGLGALFPFLIFILIGLFRFVLSKKQEKKPSRPPTPPTQRRAPELETPSPRRSELYQEKPVQRVCPPSPAESSKREFYSPSLSKIEEKRMDEHYSHKERGKSRIQNLVQSAGGKRKMILLTEIIRKDHTSNF